MFKDFAYYDIIITAVLAYFLFCQKLNRERMRRKYITQELCKLYTTDNEIFDELVAEHLAQTKPSANAKSVNKSSLI